MTKDSQEKRTNETWWEKHPLAAMLIIVFGWVTAVFVFITIIAFRT